MTDRHPDTLLAQAMGFEDPRTGAVTPAIHPATTFVRDPDNQYSRGYSYNRDHNPSYDETEKLLCTLEGGAEALLFASGMAAATSVFLALKPGDRVLVPTVMYWGLRQWLHGFAQHWGLIVDSFPPGDLEALAAGLRTPTRLVWLETPSNPTWVVTDIKAAAQLAHDHGALVAVDSTVVTPLITQPLALGADIVMHSATKYLNGHSDVLAGALITARQDDLWERIHGIRHDMGACLGSFEAWLLLRGMRTLHVRLARATASAMTLATRLQSHPAVAEVLYPGLPDHPGHAIAARQMTGGFGGMLSLRVKGGETAAIATAARVRLWKRATSLGSVESLIEHRASIEGEGTPVPGDLLRLAVGLEDVGELYEDLAGALGE